MNVEIKYIEYIEEAQEFSYQMAKKYLGNISSSSKVIIKPNILAPLPPSTGATTHHEILCGVLDALKGVKDIKIVESCSTSSDFDQNIKGWDNSFLNVYPNVELINLTDQPKKKEKIAGIYREYNLEIPEVLLDYDILIDLQVMKTHVLTGVSLGIKNLFGLIPQKNKSLYHIYIHDLLFAILKRFPPHFTILDGIVGMQGMGPIFGKPAFSKIILASPDVVAADTIAAQMMGFDPYSVLYLKNAIDYRSELIYQTKIPLGLIQPSEYCDHTIVHIEFSNETYCGLMH